MKLNFQDQVAVVTGAGAGLGRAYALMFAERGAKVVVNDLGGGRSGDGNSSIAADRVVEEIQKKGGIAVADYNSVVEGEKIIRTALENFGRIDILVNNAGILRDKSFVRINDEDWDTIQNVHVKGAFKTTQAAWPHFRKNNYGRVVFTSSNSGLYGNFGQANYSSAKMALVGLCNTLALEGRKYNIHCNVIVPTAASRLTEDILPPDFFEQLKPELIAPVVCWLCHENCEDNGSVIESAAGWATKYFLMRGQGCLLRTRLEDFVSIEDVKTKWGEVTGNMNLSNMNSIEEASATLMNHINTLRDNENNNNLISKGSEMVEYNYNEKSLILYALGIGISVKSKSNLKYLYEGHESFCAFPTFAILPGLMVIMSSEEVTKAIPGREFDLTQILHGEQYLEIIKPLPISGKLLNEFQIVDVLDKGKGAVIIVDVKTFNESGGQVAFGQTSIFVVNAGGFGGKRKSENNIETENVPNRTPDNVVIEKTLDDQAALYRLSGDSNPLHIDPVFASIAGHSRPILHGLCTLGFSARHVLETYANNDSNLFKAIKVRFVKPVLPGDTIKTEMWQEKFRIHFQTSTVEKGEPVISGGYIDLYNIEKPSGDSLSSNSELLSDTVFSVIEERLNAKKLTKKINGVFVFNITKNGNKATTWILDLKKGKVNNGEPPAEVDTVLTITDEDMLDIATGKLNPQAAFMKGKLKIKGNLMLVKDLNKIISSNPKL